MGLKTKWNRFWTLRNTEGGFTLVELIVVIAILAILAGIAVPTYSGYIKKAREATDMQLIAAVNTAFGAACLEQGIQTSDVEAAAISVIDQKVFGISDVSPTTTEQLDFICSSFNSLFAGNNDTAFLTENVMSLRWVPEDNSFEMDHENSVSTRIRLNNGRSITVLPEDIEAARASGYADMGVGAVTEALIRINGSSVTLATIAGSAGMLDRLTNAMVANGYMTQEEANQLGEDLSLRNWDAESRANAANTSANGLQMCVAEYISGASEAQIQHLAELPLGNNTLSLIQSLGDEGGTVTSSAIAMQYALAQSFANSSYAENTTISVQTGGFMPWQTPTYTDYTVSEYLATEGAQEDPVAAIATVQGATGYDAYMSGDQYGKDIDGFAATMSAVGGNLDAIGTSDFLQQGITNENAQTVLGVLLGQ